APGHVTEVGLERRRVHRDEHVRRVTWGQDVVVGKMQLEARTPGQGAGGGADLGREVLQHGQVVAKGRSFLGKPVPCELHAVARVTGETDYDAIELLDLLGHSRRTSSARRSRTLWAA